MNKNFTLQLITQQRAIVDFQNEYFVGKQSV